MLNFIKNIKSALIIGGVAFVVGAASSWYVSYKFHEAAKVDLYEKALEQQKAAVKRAIEQHEIIRSMDDEFLSSWNEENEAVQLSGVEFQKKVGNYVKNNDACNLSVGAVGMLNTLVGGGQANVSALSKTTGSFNEESQKPSKVDQLKTLQHHGSCIENYNKLKVQHNNMVDWINKTYNTLNQE